MLEKVAGELCSSAIQWGPGMVLVILILLGLYKIAVSLGERVGIKIIESLEKPAAALNKQAEALTVQSGSMDRLTGSIQDYVKRDADEHKELIILQRVIRQDLVEIRDLLQEERRGHEDRKTP